MGRHTRSRDRSLTRSLVLLRLLCFGSVLVVAIVVGRSLFGRLFIGFGGSFLLRRIQIGGSDHSGSLHSGLLHALSSFARLGIIGRDLRCAGLGDQYDTSETVLISRSSQQYIVEA